MTLPYGISACLILAVILIVLGTVFWLYQGSKKISTVPGLEPGSGSDGNILDIQNAGSMTEFLDKLHKEFGPIASFWIEKEFTVSIASPELFKEVSHMFDKPVSLFKSLEPLIGPQSIQYKNGPDGQQLRKLHDRSFTQAKVVSQIADLQEFAEEILKKWSKMAAAQEHVPLEKHMSALVMKSHTRFAFGEYFKDEKALIAFRKECDSCLWAMENTLLEGPMKPGSEGEKKFKEGVQHLRNVTHELIQQRKQEEISPDDHIFIDVLMENYTDEDMIFDDVITYLIGGAHTTSFFMTWALYFLATHEDMQDKLYAEVTKYYKGGPITWDMIKNITYLDNFMKETLRFSRLLPIAARISSNDSQLGGHVIPKDTTIITSIGTVFSDKNLWKDPETFNPDRFNEKPPPYAFEPFGFAGKRKCPAYRLSDVEASIFLILTIKQFKVDLVPGQVVKNLYGFVTKPAEEIWLTVEERK